MTSYLYNIEIVIDTLEVLERHNGKFITQIARDEAAQPLIGRINEMIDNGLAIRPGRFGHNPVFITKKGLDVLKMLKDVQVRMKDDIGSEEFFYPPKEVKE